MARKREREKGVHLWLTLWRAARSVERFARADIARLGMSVTDFAILEALYHKGPLTVGQVAGKALLTSGAMTAAIDRLAAAGLVARSETPGDRRGRTVSLTPAGEGRIADAFARHAEQFERLFAPLSRDERASFSSLAVKVGLLADEVTLHERNGS
ncbi:MAG: MarR family transcriptional regulator [Nitrospinae bacterium]|nr:MarR family transcriptional regulator [Nitrospinota bacterium]